MWRITSCAITGVACVSMTITALSPTTMPVFGSPSAVYAYAWSDRRSKLTRLGARSACDANFFSLMMGSSSEPSILAQASRRRLQARADVGRHGQRLDPARIVGMTAREHAHLAAFDEQRVVSPDAMLHDEARAAPFDDRSVDLDALAVGGGRDEPHGHVHDGRADDAVVCALGARVPGGHAGGGEDAQGRGVHPAQEVRIEDDARGIAVPELHRELRRMRMAHRSSRAGRRLRAAGC